MLKLKNAVFKIYLELFVADRRRRSILKSRWAKKHLQKYADAAIAQTDFAALAAEPAKDARIIWQYWHQGVENAPELVKKCLDSVKKFSAGYEVKVLTFDTISEYVTLPQRYYELLAQGKMKTAHFSDLLRLYLLRQYGGIWIDATIMLTAPLPQDLTEAEFFVMQKDIKTDAAENVMSCFFIRSRSNAVFLELIKSALENYWHDCDWVINYFMFEHIATLLMQSSAELTAKWQTMPYYSAENGGILQTKLFDEFNETEFEKIKELTGIHKLTYKKSFDGAADNSFYKFLVNAGD